MISEIKAWKTSDGKVFESIELAKSHEEMLKNKLITKIKYPELTSDEAFSRKLTAENREISRIWKESGLCYRCGHDQFEYWTIIYCKKCDEEQE